MGSVNPAANATARVVVDYGADPAERGVRGLVADTLARVQGFLVHSYVGENSDPSRTFTGYGPQLQNVMGAAATGATDVVYRNGGNAEISSGVVEGGNPAAATFRARLRRQGAAL